MITPSLLPVLLAAGQVWILDESGGPGADFLTIDQALAVASDGDIVLVRAGSYGFLWLDGQGVAIVADAGASVRFEQGGVVENLAASQSVLLRGLEIELELQPIEGLLPALEVRASLGHVWIEDCTITHGGPSVLVDGARVVLERCTLEAHGGFFNGFWIVPAGQALAITGGAATLHECTLRGGGGNNGFFGFPSIAPRPGGAAIEMSGGELYVAHTTLEGGPGGDGFGGFECSPPASGGPGVHLASGAPLARIVTDSLVAGGPPGEPFTECPPGTPGPAIDSDAGTLVELAGAMPGLVFDAPVRVGESLTGALSGAPLDLGFLVLGTAPWDLVVPELASAVLVQGPYVLLFAGVFDGTGTLPLAFTLGPIGSEGALLRLQSASCHVSGTCVLGSGTAAVLLDASVP